MSTLADRANQVRRGSGSRDARRKEIRLLASPSEHPDEVLRLEVQQATCQGYQHRSTESEAGEDSAVMDGIFFRNRGHRTGPGRCTSIAALKLLALEA